MPNLFEFKLAVILITKLRWGFTYARFLNKVISYVCMICSFAMFVTFECFSGAMIS